MAIPLDGFLTSEGVYVTPLPAVRAVADGVEFVSPDVDETEESLWAVLRWSPQVPRLLADWGEQYRITDSLSAALRWLAEVTAVVAAGNVVAVPRRATATVTDYHWTQPWQWIPTPDADHVAVLNDMGYTAIRAGGLEGAFGIDTGGGSIETLADQWSPLLAGLIGSVPTTDAPVPTEKARWTALRRWCSYAELLMWRRRVGGNGVFVLEPPGESAPPGYATGMLTGIKEEPFRPDDTCWTLRWQVRRWADERLLDGVEFRRESRLDSFVNARNEAVAKWWSRERAGMPPRIRTVFDRMSNQVALSPAGVVRFVDSDAPRLDAAGIDVVMPAGLAQEVQVRRRVSVSSSGSSTGLLSGGAIQLTASVLIDDDAATVADAKALIVAGGDLAQVNGRWVRINEKERARLAAFVKAMEQTEDMPAAEMFTVDELFDGVEWDTTAFTNLTPGHRVPVPDEVTATLRPYQRDGLDWLTWLESNGLGGVLADDMGLGKTLQVLTRIAADHPGPTLVVAPVTLLNTWQREAAKFTPHLRVRIHHGSTRSSTPEELTANVDVVVTSYGLLGRDKDVMTSVAWHRVVLDEAQTVKNPDSTAARVARALPAQHRLAVTGTPVENHALDLWSLLAFAQPGLLPPKRVFRARFTGTAGNDPQRLELLRDWVAPVVLRRAKTDPGLLPDLPDRTFVRNDCQLTRTQVAVYEQITKELVNLIGSRHPQDVRMRVLAAITALRQVCVHPLLPKADQPVDLTEPSGKITQLLQLCQEITDEGHAVVVFTQFASLIPPLAAHMTNQLDVPVATLTGSDSRTRRDATVTQFDAADGPPILLASLKAGGVGLTLTRANHVIHLDRWWNPAVEDQASDRVWRIGQKQAVTIHTLVCPGTLEEGIDELLTAKREIADALISSSDTAITELSAAELTQLVTLTRSRVLT